MEKKYGLIKSSDAKALVSKKPAVNFTRPSIFDEESSDEEQAPRKIGLVAGASQKRQAKLVQEKALEEDPTVYQYDEVYDEISNKRQEEKAKKAEDKKPKYIQRLLQTAEKRKIENERRIERQVQREREAEGEMFKDKEAFVTSSYRKKLEELKQAEEEEAREAYLENIGDVKKQGNLDGFYRHIYSQRLDKAEPKPKPDIILANTKPGTTSTQDDENSDEDPILKNVTLSSKKVEDKGSKGRSYRKRNSSNNDQADNASEEEEHPHTSKKAHLQSNLDADSDFSIDSSSSDDETSDSTKKVSEKLAEPKDSAPPEFVKPKSPINMPEASSVSNLGNKSVSENGHEKVDEAPKKEVKVKIDIWKKRTVGEVFDEAVKRYYERKALRQQLVR